MAGNPYYAPDDQYNPDIDPRTGLPWGDTSQVTPPLGIAPTPGTTFDPANPGAYVAPVPGLPSPPTPTPTPTPTPPPPPGAGGGAPPPSLLPPGSLGSLIDPYGGQPPPYVDPSYPTAPQFPNIPQWQSPTGADAENLPGYAFARDQGRRALENSAAARGVTNTGGTLEDIIKFGDQFAGQNYQTARANSLEDYQTNVASKYLLPYQAAYNQWSVQNPQAGLDASNKNSFNWNNYLQGYNIWHNQGNDTFNRLYGVATLGAGAQ